MIALPFNEETIQELMSNSGMNRLELLIDYNEHINSEEEPNNQ